MDRRTFVKTLPAFTALAGAESASAQALSPIVLPKPEKDGGKSVLASLWERKTIRDISAEKLPPQVLSNLLWAAFGVNRQNGPSGRVGRTAASAYNSQEIDIYAVMSDGVYLYEAASHRLALITGEDHRDKASGGRRGAPAADAPVILVYVADLAKYGKARRSQPGSPDSEIDMTNANVAVGLIAGNVHLFASSQGLAAWFHNCDRAGLAAKWKLRPEQRVLFAQTVGRPSKVQPVR